MISNAFQDIVTAFNRYQAAIAALENELSDSKATIDSLKARIEALEEHGATDSDMAERLDQLLETNTFDSLLEDKVREAVESYDFDDVIESALSGREISVTL